MRRFGRVVKLLACLVVVGLAANSARADEVVLVAGSTVKGAVGGRVRGQVQTEGPTEVVVQLGQTQTRVPIDQIASIRYDGQPASMALAESCEGGGQLAEAADLYKKAAGEAAARPFVQRTAQFKQAEIVAGLALADPGRAAEATGLLEAFVRAVPAGRQTAVALDLLARLQLQKGDFDHLDRTIADLAKLPGGALRSDLLKARASARRNDHAAAVAGLDQLIKAAPAGSPLSREAHLARAEGLAALKKTAEAEAEVLAVIKSLPAEDFAAQSIAYNTLGDCYRVAGRPKDALFAYLHTDVLYAKDREQHPRALAQISRLWRELKRDDRADEAWQRLQKDYPRSPWLTAKPPP